MNDNNKFVITIGRQFGSGGREIGSIIAKKLDIQYYDKELLKLASQSTGVNHSFFEKADERSPGFFSDLFSFNMGFNAEPCFLGSTPISDDNIYKAQSDVMHTLAEESSCVIVGRSADYVLRENPRCINIFIHASIEERVARIMNRNDAITDVEARSLAEKKNKLRANYYNFYTTKEWGNAISYDLSIDSSKLSCDEVADVIINYVKLRLKL